MHSYFCNPSFGIMLGPGSLELHVDTRKAICCMLIFSVPSWFVGIELVSGRPRLHVDARLTISWMPIIYVLIPTQFS